jgi:hypothetical protein
MLLRVVEHIDIRRVERSSPGGLEHVRLFITVIELIFLSGRHWIRGERRREG